MEEKNQIKVDKSTIKQAIELVSELSLDEDDFNKIIDLFAPTLEKSEIKELIESIQNLKEVSEEDDVETIMKKISEKIDTSILIKLLHTIIKNEKLVDGIQDIFLDKLV